MKGHGLTRNQILTAVNLFPDHTNKEILAITGMSLSSLQRIQAKYHLRKSKVHLSEVGARGGSASIEARGKDVSYLNTSEAIAKRAESWKKLYRQEDARVRWGLEQQTRIRLRHGCKPLWQQACYLRHRGYEVDEKNKVAYYTKETHRAIRLEKLGRRNSTPGMRCYFDFEPYGEVEGNAGNLASQAPC